MYRSSVSLARLPHVNRAASPVLSVPCCIRAVLFHASAAVSAPDKRKAQLGSSGWQPKRPVPKVFRGAKPIPKAIEAQILAAKELAAERARLRELGPPLVEVTGPDGSLIKCNPQAKFSDAWRYQTPWQLMAGVVMTRLPVIMRDPFQWEADWWEVEERHERRTKVYVPPEWWMTGEDGLPPTSNAAATKAGAGKDKGKSKRAGTDPKADGGKGKAEGTAAPSREELLADFKARAIEQLGDFVPAPRISEADLQDERASLDRALTRRVYLIVRKEKRGDSPRPSEWHFPYNSWLNDDVSMRKAAERVLASECGQVDSFVVGNAPAAHYRFAFPSEHRDASNTFGAKIFYYMVQYLGDGTDLKLGADVAEHLWVTREELAEYLDPEYYAYMEPMLPPL